MLLDDPSQADHSKQGNIRKKHPEEEQKQSQQTAARNLKIFICGWCSSNMCSLASSHQKDLQKRLKDTKTNKKESDLTFFELFLLCWEADLSSSSHLVSSSQRLTAKANQPQHLIRWFVAFEFAEVTSQKYSDNSPTVNQEEMDSLSEHEAQHQHLAINGEQESDSGHWRTSSRR